VLTSNSESGPYALTYAGSAVDGQLLFIRNDSGQATTGFVTASTKGALYVFASGSWILMISGA
jgi:hypothetical protein